VDEAGVLRWRIEKPGRVAVKDANGATMLIRDFLATQGNCVGYCYDTAWLGRILDVNGLLESELERAQQREDAAATMWHEEVEGRDVLVLEVEVAADSNFSDNDYLRNKFLHYADRVYVYRFDAESKLLRGLSIYAIVGDREVLAFETTEIEYNPVIAEGLFALDIPESAVWDEGPEVLEDNAAYAAMGPKETAAAFFQACGERDWEEFKKFWPVSEVPERIKYILGGLEVISLGEPFKSGNYPGYFVPYKIRLSNGAVREHNLAVRKDNAAGRYVFDGGL
jgi:hypothetical protein